MSTSAKIRLLVFCGCCTGSPGSSGRGGFGEPCGSDGLGIGGWGCLRLGLGALTGLKMDWHPKILTPRPSGGRALRGHIPPVNLP